ncbi:MAG: dockerin type I domain-containing protein [Desulfobacterales bacterium]|nr:dockerin type I domain-containing protein [Desulfobacterales bacterium]
MAAEVEAAGMIPVVVAPPPVVTPGNELQDQRARSPAARLSRHAAVSRRRFVDLYALFRAQPGLATLYRSDGLHPGPIGNAVIESALRSALDNCPTVDNPEQQDADSNGIGDACECGDVDGDGRVTIVDALGIRRALLAPRAATLVSPALCDVTGDGRCTLADAVVVLRSRLLPPGATIVEACRP